jgi:hypothetical protein
MRWTSAEEEMRTRPMPDEDAAEPEDEEFTAVLCGSGSPGVEDVNTCDAG